MFLKYDEAFLAGLYAFVATEHKDQKLAGADVENIPDEAMSMPELKPFLKYLAHEGGLGMWQEDMPDSPLEVLMGNTDEKGNVYFASTQFWDRLLVYCAPCQMIQYTCPDTRDMLESREICPYNQTLQPREEIPPESDVYVTAQSQMVDLYYRQCQIKTPGFFRYELKSWRQAPKGMIKGKVRMVCGSGEGGRAFERILDISMPRFRKETEESKTARFKTEAAKVAFKETCENPVAIDIALDSAPLVADKKGILSKSESRPYFTRSYFTVEPFSSSGNKQIQCLFP